MTFEEFVLNFVAFGVVDVDTLVFAVCCEHVAEGVVLRVGEGDDRADGASYRWAVQLNAKTNPVAGESFGLILDSTLIFPLIL